MTFDPELADRRFGYGLSPVVPPPVSITAMVAGLKGKDRAALDFPIPGHDAYAADAVVRHRFVRFARQNPDTEEGRKARQKYEVLVREIDEVGASWFQQTMARRIHGSAPFRERLVTFWADHFTARGKNQPLLNAGSAYVEDAIRPHVGGSFGAMLSAVYTHPLMLHYLDQAQSAGPGSRAAQRSEGGRGLNENLAREALELHTLGVGAAYGQQDVRELAKLLAGLSNGGDLRFAYNPRFAEPGSETVLGRTYAPESSLKPVRALLADLAVHPDTAAHLSRKLAVHFVSDDPSPELMETMTAAYLDTGGDLSATCAAMLDHPAAWQPGKSNIRPPEEFISAALRALAVPAKVLTALDLKATRRFFFSHLNRMGQPWQKPGGPDGWAEADGAWVTPQGLAGRMDWAFSVPQRLMKELPDPRDFVGTALGAQVPEQVAFAAAAAESRAEAIGLVLTSPAFMRR
jgi:uncharacterized protein (DUF1800 family)